MADETKNVQAKEAEAAKEIKPSPVTVAGKTYASQDEAFAALEKAEKIAADAQAMLDLGGRVSRGECTDEEFKQWHTERGTKPHVIENWLKVREDARKQAAGTDDDEDEEIDSTPPARRNGKSPPALDESDLEEVVDRIVKRKTGGVGLNDLVTHINKMGNVINDMNKKVGGSTEQIAESNDARLETALESDEIVGPYWNNLDESQKGHLKEQVCANAKVKEALSSGRLLRGDPLNVAIHTARTKAQSIWGKDPEVLGNRKRSGTAPIVGAESSAFSSQYSDDELNAVDVSKIAPDAADEEVDKLLQRTFRDLSKAKARAK